MRANRLACVQRRGIIARCRATIANLDAKAHGANGDGGVAPLFGGWCLHRGIREVERRVKAGKRPKRRTCGVGPSFPGSCAPVPSLGRRIVIRCVDVAGVANQGFGQAAGYVWEGGKPFYGTRVGPGWYQTGTRVARGCKLPFSVLRILMQVNHTPRRPSSYVQAGRKRRLASE